MTTPERHRSSVSGEFETATKAAADPEHSVTESLKDARLATAARDLLACLRDTEDIILLSVLSTEAAEHLADVLENGALS